MTSAEAEGPSAERTLVNETRSVPEVAKKAGAAAGPRVAGRDVLEAPARQLHRIKEGAEAARDEQQREQIGGSGKSRALSPSPPQIRLACTAP